MRILMMKEKVLTAALMVLMMSISKTALAGNVTNFALTNGDKVHLADLPADIETISCTGVVAMNCDSLVEKYLKAKILCSQQMTSVQNATESYQHRRSPENLYVLRQANLRLANCVKTAKDICLEGTKTIFRN